MRSDNTSRVSLLMCIVFLFASLSVYGCSRDETDATEGTTTAVSSEESSASDDPEDDRDTNADRDDSSDDVTPASQALEIADRAGLTDQDLRGEYELFLEYSDCIDNNPNLGEFRGYMYNLFPVIADQLEDENKDFFLQRLREFSISFGAPDDGAAAYFAYGPNEVVIGAIDNEGLDGVYVLSVYHELMHFIDGTIDGPETSVYYMSDGTFIDSSQIDTVDQSQIVENVGNPCFSEGGAEYYMARYFDGAVQDNTYHRAACFLSGIEYIFGQEGLDDIFFHHDTIYRFAQLLEDNGFTAEESLRAMHGINSLIAGSYSPDQVMNPQEVLIRLYLNNIGPDYLDDQMFCDILFHFSEEYFGPVSTAYTPVDLGSDYYIDRAAQIEETVNEQFYGGEGIIMLRNYPLPVMIDGERHYVGLFYNDADYDSSEILVEFDYDFETGEIHELQVVEQNWFPEYPYDTISSDSTSEGQALVDELSFDNSDAHDQTAAGEDPALQDVYERSAQVGSDHGVYIWYDDLVPEGIIAEGSEATDPDKISDAIDKIETVLELYPEDYFDQLLFQYYSGFVICLYDGPYDIALRDSIYADGKYYMTVFIDLEEHTESRAPGMEYIRSTYFSNADRITTELVTDIWSLTEKYFGNYNAHFDTTEVSEETWRATNHSYFYYADSSDDFWIDIELEYDDPEYLLCRESVISAENDRLLIYEYMMLSAWEEHTGGSLPMIMTDPCKNKAAELCRAMRAMFYTGDWPSQTSWESVEL